MKLSHQLANDDESHHLANLDFASHQLAKHDIESHQLAYFGVIIDYLTKSDVNSNKFVNDDS